MQKKYLPKYKDKLFFGRANSAIWMLAKFLKKKFKNPTIIFPSTMCVSPVNIFFLEKFKIFFLDVDKKTGLIDVSQLEELKSTKNIILFYVNLYGNHESIENIERINKFKHKFKFIIQDLAQTLFFNDYKKNSQFLFGDVVITSFGYSKVFDFSHGSYLYLNSNEIKGFYKIFSKKFIKNYSSSVFLKAKKKYLDWYNNIYIKKKKINTNQLSKFAKYLYLVKPKIEIKKKIDKRLLNIKSEEYRRKKLKKIYLDNLTLKKDSLIASKNHSCLWRLGFLIKNKNKIIKAVRDSKFDISSYYPNIGSRFTNKKFKNSSIIENKIINLWLDRNYNKKNIIQICNLINKFI
jgi:dTDP-4-amino-4,6-dideoxygalactose transaminase